MLQLPPRAGFLLQLAPGQDFCSFTTTTNQVSSQSSATPQKQEEESPQHPGQAVPHTRAEHFSGLLTAGDPQRSTERKRPPASSSSSTQGSLYSWSGTESWLQVGRKENAAEEIQVHRAGTEEGEGLLLPRSHQPRGGSSHEHVIVARRGKVVRIWPAKKFRVELNRRGELSPAAPGLSQELQEQPGEQVGCTDKDLPRSTSSRRAKGVKSGTWWNSSPGQPARDARGWVNARPWEARVERIHNHSPTPASGERKGERRT